MVSYNIVKLRICFQTLKFPAAASSEEDARKRLRKTARNGDSGDSSFEGGTPSKAKSGSDPNVNHLVSLIYLI
jgi:hypothetical protein